jgi:hypothetical protein
MRPCRDSVWLESTDSVSHFLTTRRASTGIPSCACSSCTIPCPMTRESRGGIS